VDRAVGGLLDLAATLAEHAEIRAIAKLTAAKTDAKPMNIAAGPRWPSAAIIAASPPIATRLERMTAIARPIGKAMMAIASIGAQSRRPTRWGRFGPRVRELCSTLKSGRGEADMVGIPPWT
jgi:hypothetical protein